MSIRQHRIDSGEKIKAKISGYIGKKITLVLANQTSVLGELKSVSDENVTLLIVANSWTKDVNIAFNQIKELFFDEIV